MERNKQNYECPDMNSVLKMSENALMDGDIYQKVAKLDSFVSLMDQVECPITHHFAKGLYAREMLIPKNTILTGRIHKFEQINMLMKGDISVFTPDGVKRLQAPFTLVTPAGTQRAGYAHEDTIWTTIIATDETDIDKVEDALTVCTYDEYLSYCKQLECK
jgi:hypothetical protein